MTVQWNVSECLKILVTVRREELNYRLEVSMTGISSLHVFVHIVLHMMSKDPRGSVIRISIDD